ncbi:MAG: aldo/keto reductase [Verrucomicrobia bacterium]|nr:aldo/keto reductase [Verrucomicrobiota bacterium]MDA1068045.1 aldo/keto reductase [Verrucomicrobiota bacterium]
MEYRNLGRSGLKVSEICLGTMTFGLYTDEAEADRMLGLSIEAGVNFIDTANAYIGGKSETILGNILGARRDDLILATKFFNPMGPGPNDSGWSRSHVMNSVEASLKRLKTDYIDIFYIHHVDVQTPIEETLRVLNDLVSQGKIRYLACSNFEAWRLMDALWISDHHDWSRIECYQPQYSLLVRDIEDELIPLCQYKGVGTIVWAPLAGGFLTGKYKPGEKRNLEGTRSADGWCFPDPFYAPNTEEILTTLLAVSSELGRSPAQVALRWVIDQPGITSAIVGARNCEQLKDNLLAGSWNLDEASGQKLTEVSNPRARYPKSMESAMFDRRNDAVKMPVLEDPASE